MPEGLTFEAKVSLPGLALEASFEVAPGETVVLVGPSGAGKTTCLFLVAGLHEPTLGRITCDGEVWCDTKSRIQVPPERRRIGFVFQDYALFPHLTVAENVLFGARARGLTRRGQDPATNWLERLGLAHLEKRSVVALSGGERQRVALARSLQSSPRVLLLDEPFGALDATTKGALRSDLRSFLSTVGLPTLLVTHDPVDALAFGDRILVLENGRVVQAGTRESLILEPRSAFVADLAGLNLFKATLERGTGLKRAAVGALAFHVLADTLEGSAFLAFAPSEVALSLEPPSGSAQNAFCGPIRDVLPMADRLRVVLDPGVVIAAEVTREAAAALALARGRTIWASVKATAIRVYG